MSDTKPKCKRCGCPCGVGEPLCAYCTIDRDRFLKAREERVELAKQGLICPNCGCREMPVYYTRQSHGTVRRARKCRACGRQVITTERMPNHES